MGHLDSMCLFLEVAQQSFTARLFTGRLEATFQRTFKLWLR